jgi:hypothetical protein
VQHGNFSAGVNALEAKIEKLAELADVSVLAQPYR